MAQRRLSYRWLLGFLIIWVVLFVIWRWYQAPREAELRLAHIRHVLAVVTQYVREHQGAWPRSWEEIEKTYVPPEAPPRQGTWPDVRSSVKVDFQVDPRKLLQTGPDQFQAISPKGRCSGDYREDVQRLLEAIRHSLPPETSPEKAKPSVGTGPGAKPAESSASQSPTSQPTDTAKEQPVKTPPFGKPSVVEKSTLPGKLPGFPEEPRPKPPSEKSLPPQPTEKEKPSPKEKTPTPSQPSRIILPGLE